MLGITYSRKGKTTMGTTVTAKGQVTIPKPIRDRLGLKPGSKVAFQINLAGQAVIEAETPSDEPTQRFARLRGSAARRMSTDEIMRLTRGDAS
jgi:AbrB family looped-hinge helix DNA binding protein